MFVHIQALSICYAVWLTVIGNSLIVDSCGCKAPVKHKYGAVVTCKVSTKFGGAEDLRLLTCTFTLAGENARVGLMTTGELVQIALLLLPLYVLYRLCTSNLCSDCFMN